MSAVTHRQHAAIETAKALIEVRAVLVNVEKPFITTAGWASPVYIDMRKIISYPRLRRRLVDFAVASSSRMSATSCLTLRAEKRLAFPMPPGSPMP